MSANLWNEWCVHPDSEVAHVELTTGEASTFGDIKKLVGEISFPKQVSPGASVAVAGFNGLEWLKRFLFLLKSDCPVVLLDAGLDEKASVKMAALCGATYYWSESGDWLASGTEQSLPDDTTLVKVTSGTSGVPSIVPCSADHLRADGMQVMSTMDIRPGDRQLGLIPFGHSYGIGNLIMPWILQGNPIFSASETSPAQIPDWIEEHEIQIFPTVPIFIKLLAQSPSIRSLAPLRTIISAGAPLYPEVARQFHRKFNLFVHNFYGSSETGGICYDRSGEVGISGLGVGQPLDGVDVKVEEDGRIRVTSPAVAQAENTHLLEDTGELLEDGNLRLLGRVEPWANIGGKKVRPREVQAAIETLEEVEEAWVGIREVEDRQWLRAVVATERSEHELRQELLDRLPVWKVPREIKVVPTLPRTARGKLDRQALMEG